MSDDAKVPDSIIGLPLPAYVPGDPSTHPAVVDYLAVSSVEALLSPEQIAEICHEINLEYCRALGDHSQPHWHEASQWQKDSAVAGVCFHLSVPEASASASHESWLKEKIAHGWRWGAVKDENFKTHPCIVPFESLPKEQQAKDYVFRAVVRSLSKL